ncbi:glutamate--cysteine ligase [Propionicicella superfundia]|uniref:glutamate--cysteine ligase n=1 Tax=Propionicicella superfundia TaxID=348582 RepID=UPI000416DC23|nr:glutamate--cysteine ligase [Propionicicella superfundia]
MQISFAPSAQSTLGIEWELALVESDTYALAPRGEELLTALGDAPPSPFRREYMRHMVEIVTGVHTTVAGAAAELQEHHRTLDAEAGARGLRLLAAGTHPFAKAAEQATTSGERYARIKERSRYWADRLVICGTHVHVGVDSSAKALPIVHGLAVYLPHLLALSASSPFWEGEDSGYASQRTMLFQQLPSAGLPPAVTTWDEYEAYFADHVEVGIMSQTNEIRWDVRPSPTFGTIENRVLDGIPTVREVAALAGLTQCITEWMSRQLDDGRLLPRLAPWFVRENKWRAARYGLDAHVVLPGRRLRELALRDSLNVLLEDLLPIAAELSCSEELSFVAEMAARGPSYERQRRVYARTGSVTAVAAAAVRECRAGTPDFDGLTPPAAGAQDVPA